MNIIEKVAEITGVNFEDLNYAERQIIRGWVNALSQKELTLDSVKQFISSLKFAVENELANDTPSGKRDLFLKARLKNLMALEAFLQGPEKAKEALESYLKNLDKGGE